MPDDLDLPPDEALIEAQRLLDADRPFHAHEVLEAVWKAAPEPERELWRGLAQVAVGITHLRRGNTRGAHALLSRAADRLEPYAAAPPHQIDVPGIITTARALTNPEPATPEATPSPAQSDTTAPTQPDVSGSAEAGATDLAGPGITGSAEPGASGPIAPGTATPAQPDTTGPAQPSAGSPLGPGAASPAQPDPTGPTQPSAAEHAQAGAAEAAQAGGEGAIGSGGAGSARQGAVIRVRLTR